MEFCFKLPGPAEKLFRGVGRNYSAGAFCLGVFVCVKREEKAEDICLDKANTHLEEDVACLDWKED